VDFGYTNDEAQAREVAAWRDAAVADGWTIQPTYEREPVERAFRLRRDGWVASGLLRPNTGKWKWCAKVDVWGPDGLRVPLPGPVYDWPALQAAVRSCEHCGAADIEPHRYSFAGRACETCAKRLEAALPAHHYD
jgi:hypothetical protein